MSKVNHVPDGDTWAVWVWDERFRENQFAFDLAVSVHSWARRLMLPTGLHSDQAKKEKKRKK